jgi:hypothetical protein
MFSTLIFVKRDQMNNSLYNKEHRKLQRTLYELYDTIDRYRGELDLSIQDEQLGRVSKDEFDNVKFIFMRLEYQLAHNGISLDTIYKFEQQLLPVAEFFNYDSTIQSYINNVVQSLYRLYQCINEEEYEEDEVNE